MTPERWIQIEELYLRALDLEGDERAALLAKASPEVCRQVQAMLEQPTGSKLMDGPAWADTDRPAQEPDSGEALKTGIRLGPYEILAPLGVGGMGEVYQARDTRLKRTVAIKILPLRLTGSATSRDRFEREARAIASLNHPHICTLHDIGHYGEMTYLVMEFLEGQTLASRLAKGPLLLGQTLQYAIQIADALSNAHRVGVIHRDLKPANIMLTKSGAKLLDFGLAKLKQGAGDLEFSHSQASNAEHSITMQGTILGTLQYMAPEQIEGRETDARTDIFAFGAVIYEMATGKKAFEGKTQASIMAKILELDPPPIHSLQPVTPAALDRLVKTCLTKDPDSRLQSAQDAKLELEWVRDAAADPLASQDASPPARWRRALPWLLFGATALLFAFGVWWHLNSNQNGVSAEAVRLQIPLPTDPPMRPTGLLALSPDGRQLAFFATSADGKLRIWLRDLNSLSIRPLSGTDAVGSLLFWSPDGRFLAFDSGGKLLKIDISGGPAQTVCVLNETGMGGSWNREGVIVFGQFGEPIMQVSAAGGVATPLTVLDTSHGEVAHTQPWFLPDGRHFVYLRDIGKIGYMSVGSLDVKPEQQDSRKLTEADLGGAYSPSSDPGFGQLLFLRGKALLAQPFDARHLKVAGNPVRVLDEPLGQWYDSGTFSVSANGTLAYWAHRTSESQLTWFDKQGNILSKVGKTGAYDYDSVALAPDGRRALISTSSSPSQNQALWLVDLSRGTSTPLELDPSVDNGNAAWSPDGHSIIYSSTQAGQTTQIYRKELSGPASPEILPTPGDWKFPLSWSPDGRFLLYQSMGGGTRGDLWVLPLKGRQKPVPFVRTGFDEGEGVFSPDGRWVAYASNESGRCEVYVRPFLQNSLGEGSSNAGTKWLVSDNGGTYPMWRHDGKELYYIDLDGKVMAVKLTAERAFQTGVPKPLFQGPERGSVDDPYSWAPSPDGKRFLFLVPELQSSAAFTIVLNWQTALK